MNVPAWLQNTFTCSHIHVHTKMYIDTVVLKFLPNVKEELFCGLLLNCCSKLSVLHPMDENKEVGEMGEEGVDISSIASSNLTGHFSSFECLTDVHPIVRRMSAPLEVLDIKQMA